MKFDKLERTALINKYPGVNIRKILKEKIPRLEKCGWLFQDGETEQVWIVEVKELITLHKQ